MEVRNYNGVQRNTSRHRDLLLNRSNLFGRKKSDSVPVGFEENHQTCDTNRTSQIQLQNVAEMCAYSLSWFKHAPCMGIKVTQRIPNLNGLTPNESVDYTLIVLSTGQISAEPALLANSRKTHIGYTIQPSNTIPTPLMLIISCKLPYFFPYPQN